ncbi:MAG: glycosyltransferase 87 family protein [Cyanobacteria bacterium P01_D01_bin.1]
MSRSRSKLLTAPIASLEIMWSRYGQRMLQVGIGLMVAAALWRLRLQLPRSIWGEGKVGPVDLISRHREVERWFDGLPVYGAITNGDYPPASYAILWPWLSWLDRPAARWLWAFTSLLMLGWFGWISIRESRATTRWEKVFIFLMPFALYPARMSIRFGQMAIHLMPPLVSGVLMMRSASVSGADATDDAIDKKLEQKPNLRQDLLAAALFVCSLVKPTLSAPFFWLVCFMPGRWRPVLLVSFGYTALALLATQFQEGNLLSLHIDWLSHAGTMLETLGHASVHTWLEAIDRSDWMLSASLLLFGAMGLWTAIYRRARPWVLLSVAAMVARFWVDHQVFDDVLLWIPLIALFRLTKLPLAGSVDQSMAQSITQSIAQPLAARTVRLVAAGLFALNWLALMTSAQFLMRYHPLSRIAVPMQTALWIATLIFFLLLAHCDRHQASQPTPVSSP